jgi:protein tyrosine/serine phosphatase
MKHSRVTSVFRSMAAVLVLPLLTATAFAGSDDDEKASLPPASATDSMGPMESGDIRIKNFGVVDGRIYRGKQPKVDDYKWLASYGIKTIVDLRQDAEPYAREAAEAAGLNYVNIKMDDKDRPYDEHIVEFLRTVNDPENGKLYVHCAGGRHRTGAIVAVYRMVHNGWSADVAYREMKAYDYYSAWGHGGYKKYVYDYFGRMKSNPSSVPAAHGALDAKTVTVALNALD